LVKSFVIIYPSLQIDACAIIYIFDPLARRHSTVGSTDLSVKRPAAARHGLPAKLMKDKPMELILIILLLVVLFGGGFGFYRVGYYRQGGPVGIGGVLGLLLVILAIGWLVHGHIGGLSL
jgi:hypothetical protein